MPEPFSAPEGRAVLSEDRPLTPEEIDNKAQALLDSLSLEDKIRQMSGDLAYFPTILKMYYSNNSRPYPAGENQALGLPGIRFTDGPRGIVIGRATMFPVPAARGATWDIELEERIGEAMGREARALGANLVAAVCVNVLRHPAWGRAQDTYGEDPHHLGEMGAALVRGLQRHVMACVKHYACNSIEDTRLKVNVRISERTLREIYLPHFKRCVDDGVACLMSAYNQVNGAYCSQNSHLLRKILKEEWDFKGFVMSDFVFGLRDPRLGVLAGLDLEMPFVNLYRRKLKNLVLKGQVSEELVDEAVFRLLRQKIRFSQVGDPAGYKLDEVASAEHRALARQAALESIVLLKNEPPAGQRLFPEQKHDLTNMFTMSRGRPTQLNLHVSDAQRFGAFVDQNLAEPILPISPHQISRLTVIGNLAVEPNHGSRGSSMTRPTHVVTPLEGIREVAKGSFEVLWNNGLSPSEAAELARGADAVLYFTGFTDKDEGENMIFRGGDRRRLELQESDVALIFTLASVNPRLAVVIMGSGVLIMENWKEFVPAILHVWYPGMEGGRAIADILFGVVSPSGKLPVAFPKTESQLPPFDNRSPEVDYGYYHGYRLMERKGHEPAYPFGFGLSYTSFSYGELRIVDKELKDDGILRAVVEVTNTGFRAGEEVVQFYIGYPGVAFERPLKELKAFARIHLEHGETKQVPAEISIQDLGYYDDALETWQVEHGVYALYAGGSSADRDLIQQKFKVLT